MRSRDNQPTAKEFEVISVPQPDIAESHWKVGDLMADEKGNYMVNQIAVVQIGPGTFEVRYYDETGAERGYQTLHIYKPGFSEKLADFKPEGG